MADRYTHAEQIGKLADRIDNLLGAMQLPLPAHMHLEGLRVALPEIRNTLRLIYTAETGQDPWSTHPHRAEDFAGDDERLERCAACGAVFDIEDAADDEDDEDTPAGVGGAGK